MDSFEHLAAQRALREELALPIEVVDPEDIPLEEIVPIVRAAQFSFDTREGAESGVALATGIDSSSWASGALVVLLHSKAKWAGPDAMLLVQVNNIALDPSNPAEVYRDGSIATSVFVDADETPAFNFIPFTGPASALLEVYLTWSQRFPESSGQPQLATISVFLIGRRHLLTRCEEEWGGLG